jgi:hypothetical protein
MKEIKDFEKWYKKIYKSGDEDEYHKFIWELMETPYTEYHYSLIVNESTNNLFKKILWSRFDEHNDAEIFLLNKLEENEHIEFIGDIIFELGKIIDLRNGKQKEKVYEYVKQYINSSDDNIREKAIIVLGWLGNVKDIELLGEKLLNDKNNKCRAWSASAFMQMKFRRKDETILEKTLPYLYKAIRMEKDYFVLGVIIEIIKELTQNKFGIARKYIDNLDKEKMDIAKKKIEKYFEKLNIEI